MVVGGSQGQQRPRDGFKAIGGIAEIIAWQTLFATLSHCPSMSPSSLKLVHSLYGIKAVSSASTPPSSDNPTLACPKSHRPCEAETITYFALMLPVITHPGEYHGVSFDSRVV